MHWSFSYRGCCAKRVPEWDLESLDGFFVADARRVGHGNVRIIALAILISDQRVTPFEAFLGIAKGGRHAECEIKLGEPGGGALNISGPTCTSPSVVRLVENLVERLPEIEWVYRTTYSQEND